MKKLVKYFVLIAFILTMSTVVEAYSDYSESYSNDVVSIDYTSDYAEDTEFTLSYGINEKRKTCIVTSYEGDTYTLNIPNSISYNNVKYTVVGIGVECFKDFSNLKTVNLPDTLTFISSSSFYNCKKLESFKFSSDLEIIDDNAFYNCNSLKRVDLRSCTKLECIGKQAFMNCDLLKTLRFPDNLKSIKPEAFKYCPTLVSLRLPSNLEKLGVSFIYGTGVKTLELPKSLSSVEFWIDDEEEKNSKVVFDSTYLTKVTLEDGTTKVPDYLFYNSNVETIELPSSITEIGESAFEGVVLCEGFKLPDSIEIIESYAFRNSVFKDDFTLPSNLTTLEDGVFNSCSLVSTDIVLPTKLSTIGTCVFDNSNITSVVISSNLTEASNVFSGVITLNSVTFVDGVKKVPDEIFKNCESEFECVLPSSIEQIGKSAFDNSCISSIVLSNSLTIIGEKAFNACSGLNSIDIPDSVKEIGDSAFAFCVHLEDVNLGEGVSKIGSSAFTGVPISNLVMPDSVTSLGSDVFSNCYNLSSIKISNSLDNKNFDNLILNGFLGCYSLESLIVPYGITEIDNLICCPLTSLYIPESVSLICDELSDAGIELYGVSDSEAALFAEDYDLPFNTGNKVKSFNIYNSKTIMNVGDTHRIILQITPQDISDKVKWSSSNSNVLSIDSVGNITAKSKGTAKITVTVGSLKKSFNIKVVEQSSVDLNSSTVNLRAVGEVFKLELVNSSSNSDAELSFYSSDEDVVKVSKNGLLTATGVGCATVSVCLTGDDKVLASCSVEVTGVIDIPNVELISDDDSAKLVWDYKEYAGSEIYKFDTNTEVWYKYAILDSESSSYSLKDYDKYASGLYEGDNLYKVRYFVIGANNKKIFGDFSNEVKFISDVETEEDLRLEEEETEEPSSEESTPDEEETESPEEEETEEPNEPEEEETEEPEEEEPDEPEEEEPEEEPSIADIKIVATLDKVNSGYRVVWESIDCDGYVIYKLTSSGKYNQLSTTTDLFLKLSSDLSIGNHSYAVRGFKLKNGKREYSLYSNVVVYKVKPPIVSEVLQKTIYTNKIEFTWNKVASVTGYEIWKSSKKSSGYSKLDTVKTTKHKLTVTGGTSYWFKIRAYKQLGDGTKIYGDYSVPVKLYSKPSTPTISLKKSSGTSIKVSWEASTGASNYEIYMSTSSSSGYKLVTTRKSTHPKYYTVKSLKKGKTYYFKVRTYKLDGNGEKIYSGWSKVKYIKLPK